MARAAAQLRLCRSARTSRAKKPNSAALSAWRGPEGGGTNGATGAMFVQLAA